MCVAGIHTARIESSLFFWETFRPLRALWQAAQMYLAASNGFFFSRCK
jgi:hypothetical protein